MLSQSVRIAIEEFMCLKDEDIIILEKMAKQNNNRYQRLLAYIEKMQNEQSINSLEEDMLQLMELQNEDSPNTNRSN